MTASLSGVFSPQEFTDSGAIGASLRLYTYVAGTTTFKAVYTDAAGTIPHTYTSDGIGGQYIGLNARGELPASMFLTAGAYDLTLKRADGSTVWTRYSKGTDEEADTLVTALRADLVSKTDAAKGAGLVGFSASLAYPDDTVGKFIVSHQQLRVTDYGAKVDGSTDDTTAWVAAIAAIFALGGGELIVPPGTSMVSSIVYAFASSRSIRIRGAGRNATTIRSNGGTSPILALSATGVLDVYCEIADLTLDGATKTTLRHGLQCTELANLKTSNLGIINCDVGFNALGCLVTNHYNPSWNSNNTGFQCAKSTGSIYSNAVNFFGGAIKNNTAWGINLDGCSNVNFYGTDIEANGTTTVLTTGQIQTATTIAAETGFSMLNFDGCWIESGLGQPINIQAAAGLHVVFKSCKLASSEGHRAMNVGAIGSITLIDIEAATPGDTVTLAAACSTVIGGIINTLADTSTVQMHHGVTGSSASNGTQVGNLLATNLRLASKITDQGSSYTQGAAIAALQDGAGAGNTHSFFASSGSNGNAAACALKVGTNSGTSRSINAGGTINASGADYAEYEVKRSDCGTFAAGAVVGFDAAGLLTDRFSLAVAFGVKSTAPAIVGGDDWFTEQPPAEPPPDADEETIAAYLAALAQFQADMEAARQTVDRIAYSGKVPVNVTGATPGQWVDAASGAGDTIVPALVSAPGANTVGRVRSIQTDGRAVVKVA